MGLLDKIEEAVMSLADDSRKWMQACDILESTPPIDHIIAKTCPSVEVYIKDVGLAAIRLATVIHTIETVPVYIIAKQTGMNILVMCVSAEGTDREQIPVFFSRSDAERAYRKEFGNMDEQEFRIFRIPFLVLVDDRYGIVPDTANMDFLLWDPREEKIPMSLSKFMVMTILMDSTYALRHTFAEDVFLSEYRKKEHVSDNVSARSALPSGSLRNKKPPRS